MMEKELPEGWVEEKLPNVANISTGKRDANHATIDGEYEFFTCSLSPTKSPTYSFQGDSVIVPGNGNVGYVFYYSGKFEAYQRTYVIDNIKINPKFLYYHFRTFWKKRTSGNLFGSTIQYVKIGHFNNYLVVYPVLTEQKRIVAKLDEAFKHLEVLKSKLAKISFFLKEFKQTVLTHAITGKLTEGWRKGKDLGEWEVCEFSEILPKRGIFDGPFGSNLKTIDYTESGIQVVRLENIEHLNFLKEKKTFISEEKYQTLIKHTVGEGDIIFSSFISDDIRACILPKLDTLAIAKADCFCIRPNLGKVEVQFLLYILVSKKSHNQLVKNIHGSTRPRINTTQLKKLNISVPSIEEQEEIVMNVDSLFSLADKIETQFQALKDKVEKLPQALLAKVFKGELVAQKSTNLDAKSLSVEIEN